MTCSSADQAEAVIIDSFGTEFEVIKGTCIQFSFCEERSGNTAFIAFFYSISFMISDIVKSSKLSHASVMIFKLGQVAFVAGAAPLRVGL